MESSDYITSQFSKSLKIGEKIKLLQNNTVYGILQLEEKYKPNKEVEAQQVFQTTDPVHPGVKKLFERPNVYLAGPITLVKHPEKQKFQQFYYNPEKTRKEFERRNWLSNAQSCSSCSRIHSKISIRNC